MTQFDLSKLKQNSVPVKLIIGNDFLSNKKGKAFLLDYNTLVNLPVYRNLPWVCTESLMLTVKSGDKSNE